MNGSGWLLVLIMLSSFVPGIIIFGLPEDRVRLRTTLNLCGSLIKIGLIVVLNVGIYLGYSYEIRLPLVAGMEVYLHADPLSALFTTLSSVLWLLTTIYAVGYLEDSPNRSHFFGYFSLCVTVTIGIALAGNLITFILFYEMLTLSTYPLIVHRGTPQSLRAGRNYLVYTLGGGALFFLAAAWLQVLTGPMDFGSDGFASHLVVEHGPLLSLLFVLLIAGVGVKAALVPLHGWLPQAMIAPAPVSALLHAVAVVKAGAFGIVRIVLDVYGLENMIVLGLLPLLTFVATLTILWGSFRALQQDDLKRRLAFSTISQISYIGLGISLADHRLALIGGLVHLVHQGIMKITLFFCAGNLAETLGVHRISEMRGIARRMPWTMGAFTVGALGMIGLPPTAGFVSKWFLGLGALSASNWVVVAVLMLSSLLNAAYFLPILITAWFDRPVGPWPDEKNFGRFETRLMLLCPPLLTAAVVLLIGVLAEAQISPLAWVRFIVEGYLP
ncbi:MAG: monovalent cation/H+ antiporter subunit D family protein [Desulfobulbaceae bacterium]|uniref:Monovalent cation/H+ antiporter subunit D family protein n=1 Tax=Candidatus Desulfatifera sulfidica TaxID=2841691 RepID=A0A8J6N8K8_9BACT|nr:monovalent cation/H+ antiporter subunit D family protein [Candidatus Desulfatifera sulfidica]